MIKLAKNSGLVLLAGMILALAACSTVDKGHLSDSEGMQTIKGALIYRERIALPPDSVASLFVSIAGSGETHKQAVAQKDLPLGQQQVPVDFAWQFAQDKLDGHQSYVLQAEISDANGERLWATVKPVALDTHEALINVGTVMLHQVDARSASDVPPLPGSEWQVEDINGRGIVDDSHITLVFDDHHGLGGSAGCNNYHTEWQLAGDQLHISPIAATLKACVPALDKQERHFLSILQQVEQFEIDREQGKLVLLTAQGDSLTAYKQP